MTRSLWTAVISSVFRKNTVQRKPMPSGYNCVSLPPFRSRERTLRCQPVNQGKRYPVCDEVIRWILLQQVCACASRTAGRCGHPPSLDASAGRTSLYLMAGTVPPQSQRCSSPAVSGCWSFPYLHPSCLAPPHYTEIWKRLYTPTGAKKIFACRPKAFMPPHHTEIWGRFWIPMDQKNLCWRHFISCRLLLWLTTPYTVSPHYRQSLIDSHLLKNR